MMMYSGPLILDETNYYSNEANRDYFSVSQFKAFKRCESAALAELSGTYDRKETTALLVGSYVDAYFAGTFAEWADSHPGIFNKRTGELKAEYRHADLMIARLESDPVIRQFLSGSPQVIYTAELFGYPWKAKFDFCDGSKIVDLKTVRDFEPIYDPQYGGRRSWVEYWGYDLQGAIYQRIEQAYSKRPEPLPFYIVAVTKEEVPDIDLIQIPQYAMDAAIKAWGVEDLIDRYALLKDGEIEPSRCEHCDWCKMTKRIDGPRVFEPEGI